MHGIHCVLLCYATIHFNSFQAKCDKMCIWSIAFHVISEELDKECQEECVSWSTEFVSGDDPDNFFVGLATKKANYGQLMAGAACVFHWKFGPWWPSRVRCVMHTAGSCMPSDVPAVCMKPRLGVVFLDPAVAHSDSPYNVLLHNHTSCTALCFIDEDVCEIVAGDVGPEFRANANVFAENSLKILVDEQYFEQLEVEVIIVRHHFETSSCYITFHI